MTSSLSLPSNYQNFIAISRYARWIEVLNRREHWEESVDRYVKHVVTDIMIDHIGLLSDNDLNEIKTIEKNIKELRVMPSMRALMTAGPALSRDNVAGFNCAFLAVDSIYAFREACLILSNGTGVGFSVEKKFVNKLPEVSETMTKVPTTIVVEDNKESWADSLHQMICMLYGGMVPNYDTSRVRKAGTPLKTFGGRASGPEPFIELLEFIIKVFEKAKGRKLTPQECHDILCKIAQVIVVGGVRRSAMISLSDLDDPDMRDAKSGAWWEKHSERALSNNSVAYATTPDEATFWEEWNALKNSGSGERGIFNREAAIKVAAKNGRRKIKYKVVVPHFDGDYNADQFIPFGTNPCSEIILRPNQFCNLTEVVVREEDTIDTLSEKVRVATILGTLQSTLTHFPNLRKIWKDNTEEERLLGVSLTGILDNPLMITENKGLDKTLEYLRKVAVDTNAKWAAKLGIPASVAITCVKPSGTVSQLVDSASGIHPRYSKAYLRTVRNDNKDPVTKLMKAEGVYWEPNKMEFFDKGGLIITKSISDIHANDSNSRFLFQTSTKTLYYREGNGHNWWWEAVDEPEQYFSTSVFYFAMKSPENAITRTEMSALDQLKLWLVYQEHWCEHKPSITVYVKDNEWESVGNFVYSNFDKMSGVSFLPYDNGSYEQAPYQEITEKEFVEWKKTKSVDVNWERLGEFEIEDMTTGSQELACTAGGCEI